ncbi:MAG: sodium:solute symporter family protein [Acidobacteriota bacterium]
MIYIAVISLVVAVLLLVSILKALRVHSQADFLVAGRKLPWFVLVFTLLSSWIGAGSLFAGGENAYRNGFAALWQPAGGWIGLIVIWRIAGRARRFAQFTVPDLLEMRFNAVARVLATLAIVISYTVITSYQMKGGGDILHLIFPEMDRATGMYIMATFVIVFTALAGMASVAYLDLVIGCLVTAIVLYAAPVLLANVGGWAEVRRSLPASHFQVLGNLTLTQALGFTLPTMLLLVGNQGMYQKFFAARSERDAKLAVAGWIAGTLVLETLIVTIAVLGSSKFHPDNPREIIPASARLGLPPLAGALLLGGVFAKVISTANNYLFSPATNIIHDIYDRFINPRASERRKLVVSRLVVIGLGAFALLQAAHFESILRAALYAYTVYGAAVTPAVMAVFFWKRATTEGAIASIGLGTAITVAWNLAGIQWLDAVYPAVAASLASLIVVSLLTPAPAEEKWRGFFEPAVEVRA